MIVKVSWDEGATFERACDLTDCIDTKWDADTYYAALRELTTVGRYWIGGGAAPLCLLMRAQQ